MNIDQIGTIIKEYRERYNISQEDLCGDFCAVSTLARIESGEELPGQDLLAQLFSRLDLSVPATTLKEEEASLTRFMLNRSIMDKYLHNNFDYINEINTYLHCAPADIVIRQYCAFFDSLYFRHETNNIAETICRLEKSLQHTMPTYKVDIVPTARLLTDIEFFILYEMTFDLYKLEKKELTLHLSEYLVNYLAHGKLNEYVAQHAEPVLWLHIAQWRLEAGNAKSTLEAAEKGIAACVWRSALRSFPKLVRTKGNALIQLGCTDEGSKCIAHAQAIDAVIAMHSPLTTNSSISR